MPVSNSIYTSMLQPLARAFTAGWIMGRSLEGHIVVGNNAAYKLGYTDA